MVDVVGNKGDSLPREKTPTCEAADTLSLRQRDIDCAVRLRGIHPIWRKRTWAMDAGTFETMGEGALDALHISM